MSTISFPEMVCSVFIPIEYIRTFGVLFFLGALQTGVDQWLNNDINRYLGGGLGSTYGYDYNGGYGGYGGGNGGGWF